ncbi:MAG: epoxyqueuosine reductase QueH, partial [Oscillospiraceae bacterium]|nr:epoxyqueuosine reductase QueH [Oscillospiraceae bacterium]
LDVVAMAAMADGEGAAAVVDVADAGGNGGAYGLRPFLRAVGTRFDARCERCEICYRIRLEAAARYAAHGGYEGFSTTLLISPYQQHDRLRAIGEQVSLRYGVRFVYQDFRPMFRAGQNAAREMGLYRQKYCGCIFSEEERYAPTNTPANAPV